MTVDCQTFILRRSFLCATSVWLCVSVVKSVRKTTHHRDTEIALRTTEKYLLLVLVAAFYALAI